MVRNPGTAGFDPKHYSAAKGPPNLLLIERQAVALRVAQHTAQPKRRRALHEALQVLGHLLDVAHLRAFRGAKAISKASPIAFTKFPSSLYRGLSWANGPCSEGRRTFRHAAYAAAIDRGQGNFKFLDLRLLSCRLHA